LQILRLAFRVRAYALTPSLVARSMRFLSEFAAAAALALIPLPKPNRLVSSRLIVAAHFFELIIRVGRGANQCSHTKKKSLDWIYWACDFCDPRIHAPSICLWISISSHPAEPPIRCDPFLPHYVCEFAMPSPTSNAGFLVHFRFDFCSGSSLFRQLRFSLPSFAFLILNSIL
jgi:hypothetical protein